MSKKLYEEADIQDIALAIREKNNSADKYKTSEMGNAIRSIQTGVVEENRRVYTGTITETLVGGGVYKVLVKDDVLKSHRNDEKLFVRVEFDIDPSPYSIVKTWGVNNLRTMPVNSNVVHQQTHRCGSDSSFSYGSHTFALNDNTTISTGVGRIFITEDGELQFYSNSASNYAIRPSNYTVIVEW